MSLADSPTKSSFSFVDGPCSRCRGAVKRRICVPPFRVLPDTWSLTVLFCGANALPLTHATSRRSLLVKSYVYVIFFFSRHIRQRRRALRVNVTKVSMFPGFALSLSLYMRTHRCKPPCGDVCIAALLCGEEKRQNSNDLHSTDTLCLRRVPRIVLQTHRSVLTNDLDS
jgi:hypothetical protein